MPRLSTEPRRRLTKTVVDALAPRATEYEVIDADCPGFAVRIWPSGRKVYVYKYQLGGRVGRRQRVTIGAHGVLTPDQARRQAEALRGAVASGRDPAAERRTTKARAHAAAAAPTVAELIDAYLTAMQGVLKPSTLEGYSWIVGRRPIRVGPSAGGWRDGPVRAALGRRRAHEVTRTDVTRLHRALALPLPNSDAPRHRSANLSIDVLQAIYTWAEQQGDVPRGTNPCVGVPRYPERKSTRALSDDELVAVGAALARAETDGLPVAPTRRRRRATDATAKHRAKSFDTPTRLNPVGVAAIRLTLLTGMRKGEVLTLRWRDLDAARKALVLADSKTGGTGTSGTHRPLGGAALVLLEGLRAARDAGTYPPPDHDAASPYVFPGTKPGRSYAALARVWDAIRHAAGVPDVRFHDLRHTFGSVAAREHSTVLIAALLGHRDVATTHRYTHAAHDPAQAAAEQTAGVVAARLADGAATRRAPG